MALIQAIHAKEILDGRGVPTIETTIWLDNGLTASSSVSAGTATGKYEGFELRDKDPSRMVGKGVLKAVANVNEVIAPQLIGKDPSNQEELDQIMLNLDGTPNKAKLGANTTSSVSQALLKVAALDHGLPLYSYIQQRYQFTTSLAIPSCIFCMIDGGEHGSDNADLQEFQIIPASFMEYPNALNAAAVFQKKLEEVLITKKAIHSVGVLGGFAPNLYSNTDVLELLIETVKATPYTFAQDLFFGVDAAANSFFFNGKYQLKDKNTAYTTKELFEYYQNIRTVYKAIYFEDPFGISDKNGWKDLTSTFDEAARVSADSLTDTNITQIDLAVREKLANTFVLKPSKIGTITEFMAAVRYIKQTSAQIVVSHRSGETSDDFIADLAVGIGADYAKFGPVMRQERLAKYNRLSQIYTELNASPTQPAAPVQVQAAETTIPTEPTGPLTAETPTELVADSTPLQIIDSTPAEDAPEETTVITEPTQPAEQPVLAVTPDEITTATEPQPADQLASDQVPVQTPETSVS